MSWSILGIGRIYNGYSIVGISCWLSPMHKPPWLPIATEVDLSHRHWMSHQTCTAWMHSWVQRCILRLVSGSYAICRPHEMTRLVASVATCCTLTVQFQHQLLDVNIPQWSRTSHSLWIMGSVWVVSLPRILPRPSRTISVRTALDLNLHLSSCAVADWCTFIGSRWHCSSPAESRHIIS